MSRRPAVAVLGAAGGIGQPLALLLKTSKLIGRLSLFDLNNCAGVAADLSHIDSGFEVAGYTGHDQLNDALAGADIVVIPAGMPRKPGMARDDLFNTNASVVHKLVEAVAKTAPKAWIGVITNPVNSTVPIAAETLKKAGVYDPRKLFGVTTLDLVRASRFLADSSKGELIEVPVLGGHSGPTIIPVLSGLKHGLSDAKVDELIKRIQFAGEEVVKAKAGGGSATLSMAYAGRRWVEKAAQAFAGESGVTEYAFVDQKVHGLNFFATRLSLGKDGISEHHPVPKLDEREEKLLKDCIAELTKDINKGLEYAKANLK